MSVDVHSAPTARPSQESHRQINPVPFLPLPTAALHDLRLTATDRDLLAALLEVARNDSSCYPSNRTLAASIGRSVRTVQLSLKRLVAAGWIALRLTAANPTGRLIDLCWRSTQSPILPAAQPPAPPAVKSPAPAQSPTPLVAQSPAPPVAPDVRLENNDRNVVRPILEELKAVGPTSTPDQVRRVAWRLAHHLQDVASVAYYITILAQVVAGVAVERLVAAFKAADRAVGKVRKPGSIFATTWASWQPKVLPSEINRPTYFQADRVGIPATDPPAPPPLSPAPVAQEQVVLSREAEVAELQGIIANPGHPFRRVAVKRLAKLGIDLTQIGGGGTKG